MVFDSCRIPFSTSAKGKRVEVRFPDASGNPYLTFSAMLMAGLDGIKNKIDPGKPFDKNLYSLSEDELKGVPIRIAVGSRDIENQTIEIFRRDTSTKNLVSVDKLVEEVDSLIIDIQKNLLEKALNFRNENTFVADDYEEFKKIYEKRCRVI